MRKPTLEEVLKVGDLGSPKMEIDETQVARLYRQAEKKTKPTGRE